MPTKTVGQVRSRQQIIDYFAAELARESAHAGSSQYGGYVNPSSGSEIIDAVSGLGGVPLPSEPEGIKKIKSSKAKGKVDSAFTAGALILREQIQGSRPKIRLRKALEYYNHKPLSEAEQKQLDALEKRAFENGYHGRDGQKMPETRADAINQAASDALNETGFLSPLEDHARSDHDPVNVDYAGPGETEEDAIARPDGEPMVIAPEPPRDLDNDRSFWPMGDDDKDGPDRITGDRRVGVGASAAELAALDRSLAQPVSSLDAVLEKNPQDWTVDEVHIVQQSDLYSRPNPAREETTKKVQRWYRHMYGDGPVEFDEMGRMKNPQPVNKPPRTPQPAKTKEGFNLDQALKDFGMGLKTIAKTNGIKLAISDLQRGLHMQNKGGLKTDGDLGPRTLKALRKTMTEGGARAATQARGLGTLAGITERARMKPVTPQALKVAATEGFKDLAGQAENTDRTRAAGLVLQAALNNDLGKMQSGGTKPLKQDGDVGPKTTAAFNTMARVASPDALAVAVKAANTPDTIGSLAGGFPNRDQAWPRTGFAS